MAAYLLAVCEITKPGPGLKEYSEKSAELIKKNGGEYVLRGPAAMGYRGRPAEGQGRNPVEVSLGRRRKCICEW